MCNMQKRYETEATEMLQLTNITVKRYCIYDQNYEWGSLKYYEWWFMLKIVNILRDYQFKVHDCLWGPAQAQLPMPMLLD